MLIKKFYTFIIPIVLSITNHSFAQSAVSESIIYKCIHNNGTELISNRKINKNCQPIIYKKIKKNIATNKPNNSNNINNNKTQNNKKNPEVATITRIKNNKQNFNNNNNYSSNNYNNFYNYNNSNNNIYSYEESYGSNGKTEYPRVSPQTQKNRDTDRNFILNQELMYELEALKKAESELAVYSDKFSVEEKINYRNKIERHQRNIAAIRRELRKKR